MNRWSTTRSTTDEAAPGVVAISGALLLQRRPAPVQFRRTAAPLAPASGVGRSLRRGEWCAANGWGCPPFIGLTARPRGMGMRRWRHGYGRLAAWLRVEIDGRSPGGALGT